MTNLELVEHDLTPCGMGLPIKRTIVAMSSSHSTLVGYCKETYDTDVIGEDGMNSADGKVHVNADNKYYTIHGSNVIIVQPKF